MFLEKFPPGSKELRQTAVEVEIWEGYLTRNKSNVIKTLCTYALDNAPLNECAGETLIFRFTVWDWEKNIRELLIQNNIHYSLLREVSVDVLQQLQKKKIYVAEDDSDALLMLSSTLRDAGFQVLVSACGKPIIEGNFSSVDLFILDRKMPDFDGLDICRHLRAQNATKETPVILVSALPNAGNEALIAGANDYIEKPFEMHYLLNLVSKYTRPRT